MTSGFLIDSFFSLPDLKKNEREEKKIQNEKNALSLSLALSQNKLFFISLLCWPDFFYLIYFPLLFQIKKSERKNKQNSK